MNMEEQDIKKDDNAGTIEASDQSCFFRIKAYRKSHPIYVKQIPYGVRTEYHWMESGVALQTKTEIIKNHYSRAYFSHMSKEYNKFVKSHPFHNGVAFWQSFMAKYPTMEDIRRGEAIMLLFVVMSGYGDAFYHSQVRVMPDTLIRQSEISWDEFEDKEQFQVLYDAIEEQTGWYDLLKPETKRSLECISSFLNMWDEHLANAKQYFEWEEEYKSSSFRHEHKRNVVEYISTCDDLAHLFYQFILFTNEYANSSHTSADKAWESYQNGDYNYLANTMYDLAVLLKTDSTIAKVAPVYVMVYFVNNAERLCRVDEGNDTSEDGYYKSKVLKVKPKTPIFSAKNAVPKMFFEYKAKTNIKTPRKAWVLIFQLLCSYFDQNPKRLKVAYDKPLCKFIFQSKCALIGQEYYDIKNERDILNGIIQENKWVTMDAFWKSKEAVHPLMCAIYDRLTYQLFVCPRGGTVITNGDEYNIYDEAYDRMRITKEEREKITNDYLRICLLDSHGIGNDRLSEEVLSNFAQMLDKQSENRKLDFMNKSDSERRAAAFERFICRIGATGVAEMKVEEVTEYLFRLIYDRKVAHWKSLFEELDS